MQILHWSAVQEIRMKRRNIHVNYNLERTRNKTTSVGIKSRFHSRAVFLLVSHILLSRCSANIDFLALHNNLSEERWFSRDDAISEAFDEAA